MDRSLISPKVSSTVSFLLLALVAQGGTAFGAAAPVMSPATPSTPATATVESTDSVVERAGESRVEEQKTSISIIVSVEKLLSASGSDSALAEARVALDRGLGTIDYAHPGLVSFALDAGGRLAGPGVFPAEVEVEGPQQPVALAAPPVEAQCPKLVMSEKRRENRTRLMAFSVRPGLQAKITLLRKPFATTATISYEYMVEHEADIVLRSVWNEAIGGCSETFAALKDRAADLAAGKKALRDSDRIRYRPTSPGYDFRFKEDWMSARDSQFSKKGEIITSDAYQRTRQSRYGRLPAAEFVLAAGMTQGEAWKRAVEAYKPIALARENATWWISTVNNDWGLGNGFWYGYVCDNDEWNTYKENNFTYRNDYNNKWMSGSAINELGVLHGCVAVANRQECEKWGDGKDMGGYCRLLPSGFFGPEAIGPRGTAAGEDRCFREYCGMPSLPMRVIP
jgi:hypothetical protein